MNTSKTGSGRRRWTRKQRQGLLARFHESQLTQSEFAMQNGVGLSILSKWLCLEREVPAPKVKFHQEVRLPNLQQQVEDARGLLATTELSITAITELCGFSDSSSFARTFRAVEGKSPTEYRKQK